MFYVVSKILITKNISSNKLIKNEVNFPFYTLYFLLKSIDLVLLGLWHNLASKSVVSSYVTTVSQNMGFK